MELNFSSSQAGGKGQQGHSRNYSIPGWQVVQKNEGCHHTTLGAGGSQTSGKTEPSLINQASISLAQRGAVLTHALIQCTFIEPLLCDQAPALRDFTC